MGTPALVKSSNFTMELEATYGTDPNAVDTSIDDSLLELSGTPTFSDSYDTIERNIVRQAFSSYAPIRGTQNTSGDFMVEAHGSGAYDSAPESGLAYKAAFGYCIGAATQTDFVDHVLATTVTNSAGYSGSSTSAIFTSPQMYTHDIETTSATNFEVGYPVRIMDSAGTELKLAGFITAIATDTLTILSSRETVSSALTDTDIVDCGHLYTLRDYALAQVPSLPSFTTKYFRGGITREAYVGNIMTQFTLDASTGQLIQPSFNWEGKTVAYSTSIPSWGAHTYDSETTDPIVCRLTDVFLESSGGTAYEKCISNLQVTLANEVYKQQCIATEGIGQVIRTKRNVTGSLNTFYEDNSLQTAFKNDTTYILRAMFNYSKTGSTYNESPGNTLAIFAPSLKFSSVGISEDTGLFKYDTQFSLEPTGTGDNEFLLAIL